MVLLLNIIPLSVLNKSYYSKNRPARSAAVIVIVIVKYFKNFIYLLIITRIVLITFLVFILIGGKPIIKSLINFSVGFYGIGSINNSPYRRYLDICTLWHILYFNI